MARSHSPSDRGDSAAVTTTGTDARNASKSPSKDKERQSVRSSSRNKNRGRNRSRSRSRSRDDKKRDRDASPRGADTNEKREESTRRRSRGASGRRERSRSARRDRSRSRGIGGNTRGRGDLPDVREGDNRGRQKGIVVSWLDEKGFGFIKADRGGEDVFVHVSGLKDGDMLREGDSVEFEENWDRMRNKYRAEEVQGCRRKRDERGGRGRRRRDSRSPSRRRRGGRGDSRTPPRRRGGRSWSR